MIRCNCLESAISRMYVGFIDQYGCCVQDEDIICGYECNRVISAVLLCR